AARWRQSLPLPLYSSWSHSMESAITDLVRAELARSAALIHAVGQDAAIHATLAAAALATADALKAGRKLLIAGNGGSAADAQHLAAEFVSRLCQDRPAMRALALTTDTSALTAIGNDYGYEHVFARQVEALPGWGCLHGYFDLGQLTEHSARAGSEPQDGLDHNRAHGTIRRQNDGALRSLHPHSVRYHHAYSGGAPCPRTRFLHDRRARILRSGTFSGGDGRQDQVNGSYHPCRWLWNAP